jgi:hypothetical protein
MPTENSASFPFHAPGTSFYHVHHHYHDNPHLTFLQLATGAFPKAVESAKVVANKAEPHKEPPAAQDQAHADSDT